MLQTSITHPVQTNTAFARDVQMGLSRSPKKLSSKYFYDQRGDELFQAIMHMPEYYLTDSEYAIFSGQQAEILEAIGRKPFDLIELGAGDGFKTKVLLGHFLRERVPFVYRPLDISKNVLDRLQEDLQKQWPELAVRPLNGDYFEMLGQFQSEGRYRKVILFLGANIGNYTREEAQRFLSDLRRQLDPGDLLLVGFDLKKDPDIILQAYNDAAGITAAFNLNLLQRVNRELDANFDPDQFRHWETYNPITGETKSYIVSKQAQKVTINAIRQTFSFEAWEAIDVELSLKYSPGEIEALAQASGFEIAENFHDEQRYFVDSLWQVR